MAKRKKILIPLMDSAAIKANQNGWLTREQREQATPGLFDAIFFPDLFCFLFFFTFLLFALCSLLGHLQELAVLAPGNLFTWPEALVPAVYYTPLLACLFFGGRLLLPIIRGRRELVEPTITTIEGQVVYNQRKAQYKARVPRLKLRGINGTNEVPLPPGVYRFYYLPKARRILSGEWLRPNEPGGPYPEILRALMHAHGFTAEDLVLNQEGHLSPRQQKKLFGNEQERADGSPEVSLATLEANVERYSGDDNNSSWFKYVWRKQPPLSFYVPGRAYYSLIPGMHYRAYYLPDPPRLVSLAPTTEDSWVFSSIAAEPQPR